MDIETAEVLHAMKFYLSLQREHRASNDGKFNKRGFEAVYTAVNLLGYLDKPIPPVQQPEQP